MLHGLTRPLVTTTARYRSGPCPYNHGPSPRTTVGSGWALPSDTAPVHATAPISTAAAERFTTERKLIDHLLVEKHPQIPASPILAALPCTGISIVESHDWGRRVALSCGTVSDPLLRIISGMKLQIGQVKCDLAVENKKPSVAMGTSSSDPLEAHARFRKSSEFVFRVWTQAPLHLCRRIRRSNACDNRRARNVEDERPADLRVRFIAFRARAKY